MGIGETNTDVDYANRLHALGRAKGVLECLEPTERLALAVEGFDFDSAHEDCPYLATNVECPLLKTSYFSSFCGTDYKTCPQYKFIENAKREERK